MNVIVLSATAAPVEIISKAAGTCYGKGDTISKKRAETCYNSGHLSVFEHASATLRVEGISRACMAQLTRHRLVSFCVESQRYCRYNFKGNDWYVMPDAFRDGGTLEKCFSQSMLYSACEYQSAIESGMKPEDARYLLPEATKTNLVMTLNARELFHILDMRWDKAAQWEIRRLAEAMACALQCESREWEWIIDLWKTQHENEG